MSRRVYYTDPEISAAEYRANKPRLIPFQYKDRDDALRRARQLREHRRQVWEIESDDGPTLSSYDIARILEERSHELAGPPTVY